MKQSEYRAAMDAVTLSTERREAILAAEAPQAAVHRRKLPLLIAAVLAAALLTVGAVAVGSGQNIAEWFADHWEAVVGTPMNEGQSAVIDHLTQHIGQSQTVGDVTIHLDSATVGDDAFVVLMKVEGVKFSQRHNYTFSDCAMELTPDPTTEGGGLGSWGFQFHGLDENGAAIFLVEQEAASYRGFLPSTEPLTVELTLTDLMQGRSEKLLAGGKWQFRFELDRSRPPEQLELPDSEIKVMDLNTGEWVTCLVSDIQVTNLGVRFCTDGKKGAWEDHIPSLLLKGGVEVEYSSGTGVPLEDGSTMFYTYQWRFPVDLSQVSGLKLGGATIPVTAE